LFFEGISHAGETEFAEADEGRFDKHGGLPQFQGA
jgi:hypothetical protein